MSGSLWSLKISLEIEFLDAMAYLTWHYFCPADTLGGEKDPLSLDGASNAAKPSKWE